MHSTQVRKQVDNGVEHMFISIISAKLCQKITAGHELHLQSMHSTQVRKQVDNVVEHTFIIIISARAHQNSAGWCPGGGVPKCRWRIPTGICCPSCFLLLQNFPLLQTVMTHKRAGWFCNPCVCIGLARTIYIHEHTPYIW